MYRVRYDRSSKIDNNQCRKQTKIFCFWAKIKLENGHIITLEEKGN